MCKQIFLFNFCLLEVENGYNCILYDMNYLLNLKNRDKNTFKLTFYYDWRNDSTNNLLPHIIKIYLYFYFYILLKQGYLYISKNVLFQK